MQDLTDHPPRHSSLTHHSLLSKVGGLWTLLHTTALRPLRFAITGGTCGILQLMLLALLTTRDWQPELANIVAFLVAAQLNFGLSNTFTWRDRRGKQPVWRRWLAFHGSIAGMSVFNIAIFWLARHVTPTLVASTLGICAAALGNFLLGDRLIFHMRPALPHHNGSGPSQDGIAA